MDLDAIRKELEKYDSIREKVLRLNELGKYECIYYGHDHVQIDTYKIWHINVVPSKSDSWSGCLICGAPPRRRFKCSIKSIFNNYNVIEYHLCEECHNKNCKLCKICLRELKACAAIKKIKTTFLLCATKFTKFRIPKDIRRIIINFLN
jgi:hypothetical protein